MNQVSLWRRVRLKEVCTEITVGHVGSMATEYQAEGVPFLRSLNVTPFSIKREDLKYIDEDFHRRLRKSALAPGDVVVVRTGNPGTACVVPENLPRANCADLVIFRPNDRIDPHFLALIFNSTWGQDHVAGRLVGVAQQHFNIGVAKEVEIALPSQAEQNRMVDILCAYQDLIENNTRRIAVLEEMARALYREWFVEFRFPGRERAQMIDSEFGRIPSGWRAAKLAELADVNAKSIRREHEPETVAYVDIASVSTGAIEAVQRMPFRGAPGRARRLVRDGDTIWSCVRPNRRSYSLILDPDPELVVSTGFAVLSPKSAPFGYIYHAVTTDEFTSYLTNHAQGAAYPAVTSTTFENAVMLKPEASILVRFQEAVEPMLRLRDSLRRKNLNLRTTRDLLLPRLISGEIDVSVIAETDPLTATT